jgi:3-(3-hydroxy-phenyl)propionate hydroxylase
VQVTSHGSAPDAKTIVDQDGEIARLFAAAPGTLYLLRPDLHVAGRWKAVVPGEILKTASLCLGSETS